jgi:hypothetical protein
MVSCTLTRQSWRSRASQWRIAREAPASARQASAPMATTRPSSMTVVMGGAPISGLSPARKAAKWRRHARPSGRPPDGRAPSPPLPADTILQSLRQGRRRWPALHLWRSGSLRSEENDCLHRVVLRSGMLLRPRPSSTAVDEGEAGADLEVSSVVFLYSPRGLNANVGNGGSRQQEIGPGPLRP